MKRIKIALAACTMMLLAACSDDAPNTPDPVSLQTSIKAVAVGATADYSAASLAVIATEAPYAANTGLVADANTDVTVNAYGSSFYKIDRTGASITKFDISAPETPRWQCSTGSGSNPYELIQISETKAFVLRYGSAQLWVVNPSIPDSSACASSFKTGEIDLSAFDPDGIPEMSSGVIVDNYLFVTLQRLTFFSPTLEAQVVVIDTDSNSLIDVDSVAAGTQAITLSGKNPQSIQYLQDNDTIYVQSVGKYDATAWGGSPVEYSGGIDTIDPTTFYTAQLIDDDANTAQISSMRIINSTQAYLVNYAGWQDNTLYRFNPSTGEISSDSTGNLIPTAGLTHQNISGLYAGPDNSLWLTVDSGITIVDALTDSVSQTLIDTKMNPSGLAFATE